MRAGILHRIFPSVLGELLQDLGINPGNIQERL